MPIDPRNPTESPRRREWPAPNLLVNGAHAMEAGDGSALQAKTGGACGLVAFTDQGPGIPPDVREKVFTPFFTTKTRGSGLGLPIAKRLIEAHNGQISIECPSAGARP